MSAALDYSPHQAAIDPGKFWLAIDERLIAAGQPEAFWTEELAEWYAAGLSVSETFRVVLARRRCK